MNPKLKMQPTKIILKAQLVQNRPKWIEWIEVEQMNRIGSNRLKWNEMDQRRPKCQLMWFKKDVVIINTTL